MTCFSSFLFRLSSGRKLMACGMALFCLLMTACAGHPTVPEAATNNIDWVATSSAPGSSVAWQHCTFPGKKSTDYRSVKLDGRSAIHTRSSSAASMLRQTVRVEPDDLSRLKFSWKVPALIPGANMTARETDDSPVRVLLAFEGDRSTFSAKNAMLSELAHVLTGEPMPYATLMYVWGNERPVGSVIINPRTDRIRKLVLESGPAHLGRWLEYERDIRADYEKAFGEAPGALVGIAIMTDTDNTQQQTQAWYGPLALLPRTALQPAVLTTLSGFPVPLISASVP